MADDEFEYDVAISFLAADESTARRIVDLLEGRYRTFIYSDHQKDLAGRDGEEKFAAVFGGRARVVVILYRPEWGKTNWTRIEETAIRNRAHEVGYDFTLWVPMEKVQSFPLWLPKTRLYLNLPRFGDTGLPAVINQLIQERGGDTRPETLQERGKRMQREVERAAARRELIEGYSEYGHRALASAEEIIDALVEWAKTDMAIKPEVRRDSKHRLLFIKNRPGKEPLCLTVIWDQPYLNHVGSATRLIAQAYKGMPEWRGFMNWNEATKLKYIAFRPDLNASLELCWKLNGEDAELVPTAAAEGIAKFFMDQMVAIAGR